jgi:RsiW-degrading membrane proteinase PrsW (M82 family)
VRRRPPIPTLQTLLVAALLAVVPTLLYLGLLNWIDRYEKEPWTFILSSVGLGAVVAPIVCVAALGASGHGFGLTPSFAPRPSGADPLVATLEELVKGALLLVLVAWVRDEFDDIVDGIVYGAALGAGFGAAETFLFAIGGTTLPAATLAKIVVSGLDHSLYTAVFGGILGYAATLRSRNERWAVIGLGLASAVLLHALHDAVPTILARVLSLSTGATGIVTQAIAELIPFLGILTLGAAIIWALRREAEVLRQHLRPEIETGVISAADYQTITSRRGQWRRMREVYRAHGLRGVSRLRHLYAAEGELAFQKRRLERRVRRRPEEESADQLRAEIRRLRDEIGDVA